MFRIEAPRPDHQLLTMGFISTSLQMSEPLDRQLAEFFTRIFNHDLAVDFLHVSEEIWVRMQTMSPAPLDLERGPGGVRGYLWGASVVVSPLGIGTNIFAYPPPLA